jgi:hypothetical protein
MSLLAGSVIILLTEQPIEGSQEQKEVVHEMRRVLEVMTVGAVMA